MKEYINEDGTPFSKEQFIEKIKTDENFSKRFGDLGPIYGKQWRGWRKNRWDKVDMDSHIEYVDQITNLINDLKTNPDSRRLLVTAWNPSDIDKMTLPPCHYGFQVYTRELSLSERTEYKKKRDGISRTFASYTHQMLDGSNVPTRAISLMWNQRSVDTFLGLPFNIASYGLLLEIIAKAVNMVPDELIGNLGDTHLYSNHIEQAKEQIGRELSREERLDIFWKNDVQYGPVDDSVLDSYNIPTRTREPYPLPKLSIKLHFNNEPSFVPEYWLTDDFELINYKSHSAIKAQLSN
jgi:thymidylate synthase